MTKHWKNESTIVRHGEKPPKQRNNGSPVSAILGAIAILAVIALSAKQMMNGPIAEMQAINKQQSQQQITRSIEQDYFVRRKQAYIDYLSDKRPDYYIPLMQSLVAEGIETLGPDHIELGSVYFHLGMIQYEDGQHKVAEDNFLRSLYIFDKHYGEGNHDSGMAYANLGHVQYSQGKYQEALSSYQQGYDDLTKILGSQRADMVQIKDMIDKTKARIENKR